MLSSREQYTTNNPIRNKGFADLDELFTENGWRKVKNEQNHIVFTKFGHELDQFEIIIYKTEVHIIVPLKSSIFSYITSFKNYFEASEYVEDRFNDYILHN
jgi:hypothetical protein